MATKGSNKARSVEQEDYIATIFGGRRSPSSGAQPHSLGDVRTDSALIECKTTGGAEQDAARKADGKPPQRSTLLKQFEKINEEATQGGRLPMMALRFWAPESTLSNNKGWVDLMVALPEDVSEWLSS